MQLYCCYCEKYIEARLTNGTEIYPHRHDLAELPFWKCSCGNFVGCHHKTKDRTKPLGCIPSMAIRNARKHIHAILDPLWQSGKMARKNLYEELTSVLGRQYHTAELRSIKECQLIENRLNQLKEQS